MSNRANPTRDPDDSRLDAVESDRPALGSLGVMQRDRAALRAALTADLAAVLSEAQADAIGAARDAAVREAMESDRAALAALSDGVAVAPDRTVRRVLPSRAGALATIGPWVLSRRVLVAAASVAIVGGAFYLAALTPTPAPKHLATHGGRDTSLPSWAVLPDRPLNQQRPRARAEASDAEEPAVVAEINQTRDATVALAWLREGRLALRLTTDAPRRDMERLELMLASMQATAQGKSGARGGWTLARADGREAAVPVRPWPIDTRMADQDARSFASTPPGNARVGGYDLSVRPTAETIVDVRDGLERATRGRVFFERVDALALSGVVIEQSEPTASQVLWWTRPMEQWAKRVRLPLVVEFGEPGREGP